MSAMTAVLPAMEQDMDGFAHVPVLLDAVLKMARAAGRPARLVDCTVGGAGHAQALLDTFADAHLLAFDRDPTAVCVAAARLARFGARAEVMLRPFSELQEALAGERVDFVLADFGVSSHQLDTPERGFSFARDAELDMRMNPASGEPVWCLIERMDATELADVLWRLGEERHSRRLARAILADKPRTTIALAELVRRVVPRSADGLHPATRTFQALRMLVNREREEIDAWLNALPHVLAPGGVAVAISFHSLEDRAVKQAFRRAAQGCICPPHLPVCGCGHVATVQLLTAKPCVADAAEVQRNPRARSARLRAVRRLDSGVAPTTTSSQEKEREVAL